MAGRGMSARLLGIWPDRSPDWFAARVGRIGGSDIGTICGWNEWETRDEFLARRLGTLEPRAGSKATARGVYCEPAIKAWLADREGIAYDEHRSTGTWVDADHEWRSFNPDAVTADDRLCEFKTCNVRDVEHGWGRACTDQIPITYAAQVQWGMGILGLNQTLLAVLSGAPRFEFALYKIAFDPDVFNYLCRAADEFLAELAALQSDRTAA